MTDEKHAAESHNIVGQRLWKWTLAAGVLTVVLGAIVLAWPGPSILVAATLFGVYLLVSGMAELFLAFTLRSSTGTRVMLAIGGALSLVLAVLSFRHFGDEYAVLLLSLWIGIGFVFQGVAATVAGVGEPLLLGRGWYIFAGIVSVIAGVVMLVWPFDSIVALTLAAGIWFVIIGVVEVVRSFQIRSQANAAHEKIEAISHRLAAA